MKNSRKSLLSVECISAQHLRVGVHQAPATLPANRPRTRSARHLLRHPFNFLYFLIIISLALSVLGYRSQSDLNSFLLLSTFVLMFFYKASNSLFFLNESFITVKLFRMKFNMLRVWLTSPFFVNVACKSF